MRPIDAVRRFWWVVVILAIVGGVLGALPEPETADDEITQWRASHTLLVSDTSETLGGFTDPQAFNQLELFATVGEVPARAAEALDASGSPASLAAGVTATSDQQTGALTISTTRNTPDAAAATADTFADELVLYLAERQDELQQGRLDSTLARLQDLEAQIDELEQRLFLPADPNDPEAEPEEDRIVRSQLEALTRQYSVVFGQFDALQVDQGQLVLTTLQRAQPIPIRDQGLSAPRSRLARGAIGGLLGAAVGFAVALVLARVDRKIRSDEHAEDLLGLEANAFIPAVRNHNRDELVVVPERHDPLSDSYRTLRSVLAFLDGDNPALTDRGSVTLVVSPGPGDGKTSVAANLVAAMAENGGRVVAVNTDFRRPTLSGRLGVEEPSPVGLELADIASAPLEITMAPGHVPELAILDLAEMTENTPGELARATGRLLPRVTAAADNVVIDSSPVGATAEVLEFVPSADNVVLVVRLGHTKASTARRAVETIRTLLRGNLLLVLVGGEGGADNYYYYYSSTAAPERRSSWFRRRRAGEHEPESVEF